MMDKLPLLIFASCIAIAPVFLVKKYLNEPNYIYLILALMCYIIVLYCYINIFKSTDISSGYTFIKILQILISTSLAIYLYDEKITKNKVIGVTAGLVCIYFLYAIEEE